MKAAKATRYATSARIKRRIRNWAKKRASSLSLSLSLSLLKRHLYRSLVSREPCRKRDCAQKRTKAHPTARPGPPLCYGLSENASFQGRAKITAESPPFYVSSCFYRINIRADIASVEKRQIPQRKVICKVHRTIQRAPAELHGRSTQPVCLGAPAA